MDYPQEHIKPYGNDGKKSEQVEEMFDNIAPAYDKLNHTLSMGIDRSWRKKAIDTLRPFSPRRIMDVDCWGVYNGMHYCAPAIIEAGGGTIVNTCSYQGTHFGPGSFIGYAMAKAAVMGMTRAAATDLGTYGIRVNAVNPGLVLSGMTLPRGQNRKGLVDASSMKRYALPEEIASVVMFLASDDSSFINGEFIAADGGATTYLHLATADAK